MPSVDEKSIDRNIESFRVHLKKAINLDIDRLVGREELGTLESFEVLRPTMVRVGAIAQELLSYELTGIPLNTIKAMDDCLVKLLALIHQLTSYRPDSDGDNRERAIDDALDYDHTFYYAALPVINQLRITSTDVNRRVEEFEGLLETVKARLGSLDDYISENEKKVEGIVTAAREAAGQLGVVHYAKTFECEAEKHRAASKKWLYALVALFIATCLFITEQAGITYIGDHSGLVSEQRGPQSELVTTAQAIQKTAMRLALLSVLYFGLVFVGRGFRSSMHNYTMNRHRFRALYTFAAFIEASEDDQDTKNAVLMHVAKSIFAPQSTGFDSKETTESGGSAQILEIIRGTQKGD